MDVYKPSTYSLQHAQYIQNDIQQYFNPFWTITDHLNGKW